MAAAAAGARTPTGGAMKFVENMKRERSAEDDEDQGQQYTAADVERRIDALHEAARTGGNIRSVGGKFLRVEGFIDAADPYGWTPLMVATRESHEQTCLDLIKFGANVNAKDEFGTTGLIMAAKHGLLNAVREMLRLGADVNARTSDGASALTMAAWKGKNQVCLELLSQSASVNQTSNDGKTPLMVAAENGLEQVCLQLIEKGADVNAKIPPTSSFYPEWTPLMFAAEKGLSAICMKLLACGADCNAVSQGGSTPLMVAAESGLEDVCLELIRLGSDMDYRDNYGRNAAAHAKQGGYVKLSEYLESLYKGLRRAGVARVGPTVDLTRPLVMVAQNAFVESRNRGHDKGDPLERPVSSSPFRHDDKDTSGDAWEQSFKALLRVGADLDAALMLAAIKVGDEVAAGGSSAAEMLARVKKTVAMSATFAHSNVENHHSGMYDDPAGEGSNPGDEDYFPTALLGEGRGHPPSTAILHLLRHGANLLSALAETIRYGLVGACSVLITLGDPDLTTAFSLPQRPDADGHAPICYALQGCTMTHKHPSRPAATERDRVEVVQNMIEIVKSRVLEGSGGLNKSGCGVDEKCALLPIAAMQTTADVVQNLLAAGASVHEKNDQGETAMVALCKHCANLPSSERRKNEERAGAIMGALLKWHANVDDTDAKGTSARHYLRTCNYPGVEAQIDDMDRERVRRNLPELGSQVEQVLREMKSLKAQVASQAREIAEGSHLKEKLSRVQYEMQDMKKRHDEEESKWKKRFDEQDRILTSMRRDMQDLKRKTDKNVEEAMRQGLSVFSGTVRESSFASRQPQPTPPKEPLESPRGRRSSAAFSTGKES
eukprot:TRINITY_DN2401_c0_g3_i1.p1 TRINITY_DN2401_c0_g3~~TRINITY_DN2401_c0_g3_i1.p1  ORF type:complete len:834 (+),score=288.30 TRINITY_DN2401_c0_g3_i1:136-2637(+)